jgi:hypothetical protein
VLEGALEAVRVVTAALLSHSGVEHLGACRALGLSGVGGADRMVDPTGAADSGFAAGFLRLRS